MSEKKTKTKGKASKRDVLTDPVRNDGKEDLEHYLDEAKRILPSEKDEHKLMEVAHVLQDQAIILRRNWPILNSIAAKSKRSKSVEFRLAFLLDRDSTPREHEVGITYSETYRDSVKGPIGDPRQGKLRLEIVETTKTGAAGEGGESGDE